MSAAHSDAAPDAGRTVLRAAELADLAHFHDAKTMLAIAPAPPSCDALRHASTLAAAGVRRSLAEVDTPSGIPVRGMLDRLAVLEGAHAPAWVSYLEEVTEVFAYLLDARSIGVRLLVSDAPHCPRFHVDQVAARAVVTVKGAGTEWFEDESLDRSRLGHAGGSDDATSGLVRDWKRLQRAEAGTLAVFKGTGWPGAAERAIVHRSPPADGKRRLLLTLDWLE